MEVVAVQRESTGLALVPSGQGSAPAPTPSRTRGRFRAVAVGVVSLLVLVGLVTVMRDGSGPSRTAVELTGGPACTQQLTPTPDLAAVVATLEPGDVACLAPGVYGARGSRTDWEASGTSGAPITVRAHARDVVLLRGFQNLSGSHWVLDGLVFDGPTGAVDPANTPDGEEVLVWAQGDGLVLRRCEVRDGRWRAGVYVTGSDVTLDSCHVHDIGPWDDPDQEQLGGRADNVDHGVYWGVGSSGTLVNSVLEHNLAYGVQISEGAGDVLVAHNTIVHNGTGGLIWAEETSGSTFINNIVAFNTGYAVNAHLLTGSHNVARDNLAFGNTRGEWNDNGVLVTRRNRVADPMFAGAGDYRLRRGSPAVDAGAAQRVAPLDHAGVRRPQGAGPDIGAHEQRPEPAAH